MDQKINDIVKYLDLLYPDATCELLFNNDFELLIAVTLSAQTTDKAVNKVTPILFKQYPSIKSLANASIKDVENILKVLGLYKNKAKNIIEIAKIIHFEHHDIVPNNRVFLEGLPGVGRKTCNVVLSNAFDYPAIAVDTHVFRVSKRLKLAYSNDSVEDVERKLMNKFDKDIWTKLHHQLVLFGRYHCKASNPNCNDCHLTSYCRHFYHNNKVK